MSRVTIAKVDYTQDEVPIIPFIIKLNEVPFDIEYITPVSSETMFFVKLKNSDNAVVIKIFEWLNIQTNELQIDYLVRLIKWTYDGFLMNPDGKENPAFEGRWRSKDDLNPGYSDDDPIKQRKLLVFTLYEDKVPVENLIVDFQRCYLHVRTNHPSTYSESDRQSNFVYKAILKTSNPEEVDIVQEFKIVLI